MREVLIDLRLRLRRIGIEVRRDHRRLGRHATAGRPARARPARARRARARPARARPARARPAGARTARIGRIAGVLHRLRVAGAGLLVGRGLGVLGLAAARGGERSNDAARSAQAHGAGNARRHPAISHLRSSSWRVRPLHDLLAQHGELAGELAAEVLQRVAAPRVGDAALLREVDDLDPLALGLVEVLLEVLRRAVVSNARDQVRVRWLVLTIGIGIGAFAIFCAWPYWMSP